MPGLKPSRSAGAGVGSVCLGGPTTRGRAQRTPPISWCATRCRDASKWGVVHRSSPGGATRVHRRPPRPAPSRPTRRVNFAAVGSACNDERVTEETTPTSGTDTKRSGTIPTVIHEGLPTQLPDIDPDETNDWIDSFDSLVDERGRERARYVMLRLLERAREMQVGVPALRSTDYINTIPPEREPWFPGDEEAERRIRAFIRWNAAVMVSSANRKGLEVGGHIATYQSSASLYEVGFNHFFRGKDAPRRRRPDLHPGPRLPRHLRPRLPRGPADRGAALPLPPGGPARAARRPVVVPPPAADAGVLGVPDGLDGPDRHQLDLPGAVQPLPAQPRHQGHQRPARLGVPRRRRDGRARVARRDPDRRPRGARQPHLGHQLQPAAARRTGHRQRQDHPGARGQLPRRRLERHQGRLGPELGPAARPRRRRRARQQDEHHPRRRVPDLLHRGRRLRARELLRRRPAAAQDGRAHERRADREAAARRPRLPQGVRRVRRGHQARRPADGDPGQDHQGLDDRRPRGQERHPPDEEADPGRPQEVPGPPLPADLRPRPRALLRGDRRRAVLPPGRGRPRDRVHARAPQAARRLAAQAGAAGQEPRSCPATTMYAELKQGSRQELRSPPRWPSSGCSRTG